jgi:tight adherence protein C
MDLLLPVVVFLFTVTLVAAVASFVRPRGAAERLSRLGAPMDAPPPRQESLLVASEPNAAVRALQALGRRSTERGEVGALRQRMVHAGYRHPAAVATYYGLRLALAVGLPLAALSTPVFWTLPRLSLVIALCALAGAGMVLPSAWLDLRRNERQGEIRRMLPDALDLMVVCVEAGYGINQSLARVTEEFASRSPVLSTELGLAVAETRAGKGLEGALRGLSERTGVDDVSSLVALLVQTERFGTSVANALRVHAEAMRVRRMLRAEERAQKAPLKLIFPSTLIFAALMLVFLAPSLYRFMAAFPDTQ